MVLAVLLFASACSEPMDTTVAHYEPTEKNQADFAELEQRLADVNAAVAELTDETGCVAPENHEAALAAAEAYGKAAVDSGTLLSCAGRRKRPVYVEQRLWRGLYSPFEGDACRRRRKQHRDV